MPADLTIEQLAAQSGMTVRNIRAHQARGLIGPPEVRMRVGYYGPEHVAALQLIRDLQQDGFNLAAIKRLLADRERTEERLERFRASVTPTDAEPPQTLTASQLRDRLGLDRDEADQLLARAERLGVIVRLGDGRYEAPSPSLLAPGEEVVASATSLAAALDVYELAQERVDPVAAALIRRFVADAWRDAFQSDGER